MESKAGIDEDKSGKLVQAHGANFGAECARCYLGANREDFDNYVTAGEVMRCQCGGPIKPAITFFGEGLPLTFSHALDTIRKESCDLMIVIGTGLAVAPFNSTVMAGAYDVPRVLMNL